MQDRDDDPSERRLPDPPGGSEPVEPAPTATPQLPPFESHEPVRVVPPVAPPSGAGPPYRTDRDRDRSVRKLANPWYRRLARGLVGMVFIAAACVAVFFGAQLVQDLLDRDTLPAEGADVPTIRSTTIEIRSTTPAPVLDGTITLDTVTRSYEFVGRGTGAQAGTQVVSPDGSTVYVRRDGAAWLVAPAGDQLAASVQRAVDYLVDDDSADDILTPALRDGYVELVERVEIGEGDDAVVRYEMRLDTAALEENSPIDFVAFEEQAIPGVGSIRGLTVTITVDADDVLVGVDDDATNWTWQRTSYSDQAFVALDPSLG